MMVMIKISMMSHYLQQRVVSRRCQNHDISLCQFLLSLSTTMCSSAPYVALNAADGLFEINRSKHTEDSYRSELACLFEISRLDMFLFIAQ